MSRPKINSISVKLGALLFVVFFILVISVECILYLFFVNFYTKDVVDELTQRSDSYAVVLSDHFNKSILNHAGMIESTSSKLIMVVDNTGEILASSKGIASLSPDYLEEVIHHGDEDHGSIIASDWKNQDYFIAQSFIERDDQTEGKIIMFSPTYPVRQAVTFLKSTFAVVGVVTLIFSALLIFMISNKIVHPLLKIIYVTRLISEGKYDWELKTKGSDEIAELSYSVKHMSEQIQNYQQLRTQFFVDISHELRTPLTYFKGYVEVLLNGMVTSEEDKKKYLHLLYNQSGQLQRLVQDLSDLSKLENGDFTLHPTCTSLETVMVNALEFMGPSIEQKGIELSYQLSPLPLYVPGDVQRLQQVMINLLENAKKYTPASGEINVSTYQDKGQCVIEIADTGDGIPEKDLPHIWERLYRVDKSRSRDTGGSGLGLTICQKIIALHQGEITVNSEEGRGTTFQIKLPIFEGKQMEV